MKRAPARVLRIPPALRELHGEEASAADLGATYLAAAVAGIAAFAGLAPAASGWRLALAVLVFADIGGGTVANFTPGTMRYYRERPRLRLPFLIAHLLHPALLCLSFPAALPFLAFSGLFTVGSGIALAALRGPAPQERFATLLLVAGGLAGLLIGAEPPFLLAFAFLMPLKIVMGFSVLRPLPGRGEGLEAGGDSEDARPPAGAARTEAERSGEAKSGAKRDQPLPRERR